MLFMETNLLPVKSRTETVVALLTDLDRPNRAVQPVQAFWLAGEQRVSPSPRTGRPPCAA